MKNNLSASDRRGFLGAIAKGAAALGLGAIVSPLHLSAKQFNSVATNEDPEQWFRQFTGRHKIAFDATNHHGGVALSWSWAYLKTNNETNTPDNDLSVLVILRQTAIAMALENRIWEKYNLGEEFGLSDKQTNLDAVRNIFWESEEEDLMNRNMSIDNLQRRGVKFCACEMAFTVQSNIIGEKTGIPAAEIRKDWIAGLLPNIQLVPSGVWAISRAHEQGMAYCFAG